MSAKNWHSQGSTYLNLSLTPSNPASIVTYLRALRCDIIVFGDNFMDSVTSHVLMMRSAPIQVLFWGHPYTTGYPTVDYFITGDTYEAEIISKTQKIKLAKFLGFRWLTSISRSYLPPPASPCTAPCPASLLLFVLLSSAGRSPPSPPSRQAPQQQPSHNRTDTQASTVLAVSGDSRAPRRCWRSSLSCWPTSGRASPR